MPPPTVVNSCSTILLRAGHIHSALLNVFFQIVQGSQFLGSSVPSPTERAAELAKQKATAAAEKASEVHRQADEARQKASTEVTKISSQAAGKAAALDTPVESFMGAISNAVDAGIDLVAPANKYSPADCQTSRLNEVCNSLLHTRDLPFVMRSPNIGTANCNRKHSVLPHMRGACQGACPNYLSAAHP